MKQRIRKFYQCSENNSYDILIDEVKEYLHNNHYRQTSASLMAASMNIELYFQSRILELQIKKQNWIQEQYRKYMAAYKIKNWWKSIYWNPHHPVGQKQINKKYDGLVLPETM